MGFLKRIRVSAAAFFVIYICFSQAVTAATIVVDVLDANRVSLTLSGTLTGNEPPSAKGILFIDTPVDPATKVSASSLFGDITGDGLIGALSVHSAFSGYDNPPYGGSLQLRSSSNGSTPYAINALLSGSVILDFGGSHGMTQSMFDGGGVPIYWGGNVASPGILQGYAVSVVPIPAAVWLFASALGLIGWLRRSSPRPH